MIIVSQDKKSIYNFDNIKSIDIVENEIYITDDILMDEGAKIGEYETEERAKEVLSEIIQCNYNTEALKFCNSRLETNSLNELQRNAFVYEMPQE